MRLERIKMDITEDDIVKILNHEELYKKNTGSINNEIRYELILESSSDKSSFIVNLIKGSDIIDTNDTDLNGLLYTPLILIKISTNLNLLAILSIPNYRNRYHLNDCKRRTNLGCEGKFDARYVSSLILHNSFNNEQDLAEVLFLYLNLNYGCIEDVDFLLKEKLEYYGYSYENFEDLISSFTDEKLSKISDYALNLLYKGQIPIIQEEDLKTYYNRFQHNIIKINFKAKQIDYDLIM